MCFNILLFLKIDQIIVKIGKFFTWNLIQCRYKIIFIIFMNQKTKRQIKNLKKKKEKKQSSKHLHSFHPLPLFLSNKTVQIDTHPHTIIQHWEGRYEGVVDCLCHLPAPSNNVPCPFVCHVRIFVRLPLPATTCHPRHARPTPSRRCCV